MVAFSTRTPTGRLGYVLDRESPGRGFRHVLSKPDLQAFIDLIPDWDQLSRNLERIVLASRGTVDAVYEFYHREETGSIFLHAWDEDLWVELTSEYFEAHADIFQRIGVSFDPVEGAVMCRFTEAQGRAFMLLHVFMHELGHHHDRLHQKHRHSTKGEDYAERFATGRFNTLFPGYVRVFEAPRRCG